MAAASPHRPPPPKPLIDLDVTVISAKHLKNVNWRNGDLKPYAVAYLDPDRRSATKPDDSGSTRPVWNERLTLPLPFDSNDAYSQTLTLTLDIFHSKPSETPKPLVGTVRVPFKDLVADLDDFSSSAAGPAPIKTLELRRPSGRPQGKVRIKVAVRERPLPPPPPPPEQNYQIPPPPSGYYYSTAPPPAAAPMPQQPLPHARDYRTFSQPPPPVAHYSSTVPSRQSQYSFPGSDDAAYYDPYYYSSGAAYYSPPALAPARPVYYDRPGPASYGGPSAPVDYSPSYEQKAKGPRMGMGAGLAVGAVAGALGGLALEEGVKYEEEKIAERVESDMAARDDYSDYRADY